MVQNGACVGLYDALAVGERVLLIVGEEVGVMLIDAVFEAVNVGVGVGVTVVDGV